MSGDLTRQAYQRMQSGNLDEAEMLITQALAQTPDSVDALYIAGLLAEKKGDVQKEVYFARRLVELRPADAMSNLRYANALYKTADIEGFSRYGERSRSLTVRDKLRESLKTYQPRPDLVLEGVVVMGYALNYTVDQIAPFVISLRQTGYQGNIVLFVNDESDQMIDFLAEYRIEPVYNELHQYYTHAISQSRYFSYYDYLRKGVYGRKVPARVMMSDVRDVVFQRNPFDLPVVGEVTFILEDPRQKLGTCAANSKWIHMGFGRDMLNRLAQQRISCSGTILGNYHGIIRYMLKSNAIACGLSKNAQMFTGMDQGIHNYMLYVEPEKDWGVLENGEGVLTCAAGVYKINNQGLVCNLRGEPQAVVHQYDRFEDLTKLVAGRYSLDAGGNWRDAMTL